MVTVMSLWLPILLAAVFVFIASSIIHMFLSYHRSVYKKVPDEEKFMEAMRGFDIPPADYVVPCASGPKEMKSPEYLEKVKRGPVTYITVLKPGSMSVGKSLVQWFIYCIVVGIFAAYISSRALGPGADYLEVFRFAGCTAFVGYSLALWQNSIWFNKSWKGTLLSTLDGLIYGLLTAGVFGWLWP